jgi:hypothetical protein
LRFPDRSGQPAHDGGLRSAEEFSPVVQPLEFSSDEGVIEMSGTNLNVVARPNQTSVRAIGSAGLAILGAAATAIYGAYGDPSAKASQEHAVPFIVAADAVIALLVFGLLVPWARRSATRSAGVGLALAVIGLVAIPVVFWSGMVIVVAASGTVLGLSARHAAAKSGRSAGLATTAVSIGVAALVVSTLLVVLGNTVLA